MSSLFMNPTKKSLRDELKRMKAAFSQIKEESKRKPNLNLCMKCKQDAGKNFILIYKKNSQLKGKICIGCYKLENTNCSLNNSENKN